MSAPMDRLTALEMLEKEITSCLQSAGQVLNEMSKDKPNQKQVDIHANHFLKTLNHVELELSAHINYLTQVSTGQAHEGSSYAGQKNLQMAWHRLEHARSKVLELERSKNQLLASSRGQGGLGSGNRGSSGPTSFPPTPTSQPQGMPPTAQS